MCGRLTRNGEETFYQDIAGYSKWANVTQPALDRRSRSNPAQPVGIKGPQHRAKPGIILWNFIITAFTRADTEREIQTHRTQESNSPVPLPEYGRMQYVGFRSGSERKLRRLGAGQ